MNNEWKLNARQMRFCQEYARCLNGTKAYSRVYEDTSIEAAATSASELLRNPHIQAYVAECQRQIAAVAGITDDWIAARWQALAAADPNELMQHRRVCCRFCHGVQHRYQWTQSEFENYLKTEQAQAKKDQRETCVPDTLGGFGFNAKRPPHDDCPECYGEGEERVFLADTRTLSPGAKALFAGVKQTQHGIEIKVHDQLAALGRLADYRGMAKKVNVVQGSVDGGPVKHEHTVIKRAADVSDEELLAHLNSASNGEDDDSTESENTHEASAEE